MPEFLVRGGEMGRLIAAHDWAATSIGAIGSWPPSLRTAVSFMLSSSVPMTLLWGSDGVMLYNQGYAVIACDRHPSILGSRVLESWPEVATFNREVLDVGLSGGCLNFQDQHLVLLRNGTPEDVWLDLDYSPVFDEAGEPAGVLAIVHEITRRHIAEREMERSRERLSHALSAAGIIGIWDWHLDSGLMFADSRFASFFAIDAGRAEAGVPRSEILAAIHPADRERVEEDTARTLQQGGELALEHRLVHPDGSIRWIMVRGTCFRDPAGRPIRLSGAAVDMTDRRLSEEKRRLLVRELHHRIKNTFAIIGGMVTMTARSAKTVQEMAEILRGRLVALAGAHELIRPAITAELDQTEETTLADLFAAILSPHLIRSEQLLYEAPDVQIGVAAATSLALVLHELATNSSKYGSLSTPNGTLRIVGRRDGEMLRLQWTEEGGPPIDGPPLYQGFGSRLASMSVVGQLGGELEFHWKPAGLEVILIFSADRLSR